MLPTYLCLTVCGKELSISKRTKVARRSYRIYIKLTSRGANK